jgi:predicted nucleic acid-binding Zn ribbon protein
MDINTAFDNIKQAQREWRTIMLESQTPAYARTLDGRRANDLIWKRANNLRRALANGGIPMSVAVCTIVPHKHEYVSGLNVPTNYQIVCGKDQSNAFKRTQRKAKKGLEARNV